MSNIIHLWRRKGGGRETGAFEDALRPHIVPLYRLARHYCGQPEDAEDLVQDLICRLYARPGELPSVDKPRPWLARILYRMFVDRFRRDRLRPAAFSELEGWDDGEDFMSAVDQVDEYRPEQAFDRDLTRERLQGALDRLPEFQRILLIMHDVEHYTLKELESILDCPVGTLKSRLHRGRTRLRAILLQPEGTV